MQADRNYANGLLEQAEANEIWAALSSSRKAAKLNKAAKAMREEAVRIMDKLNGAPDPATLQMSDEELLADLGILDMGEEELLKELGL